MSIKFRNILNHHGGKISASEFPLIFPFDGLYNDGIPSFENDDQDLSKADQHIVEGTSDATPQIWQRK
jgi:hypothetical protein